MCSTISSIFLKSCSGHCYLIAITGAANNDGGRVTHPNTTPYQPKGVPKTKIVVLREMLNLDSITAVLQVWALVHARSKGYEQPTCLMSTVWGTTRVGCDSPQDSLSPPSLFLHTFNDMFGLHVVVLSTQLEHT